MYKMCKNICTLLVLIRFSKVMYFFFICNNNLQLIFHFTPPYNLRAEYQLFSQKIILKYFFILNDKNAKKCYNLPYFTSPPSTQAT